MWPLRLPSPPGIVSVMLANNETGVVQDVAEIAERARAARAWVHTDAVQALGKIEVDFRSAERACDDAVRPQDLRAQRCRRAGHRQADRVETDHQRAAGTSKACAQGPKTCLRSSVSGRGCELAAARRVVIGATRGSASNARSGRAGVARAWTRSSSASVRRAYPTRAISRFRISTAKRS